MNNSSSYISTDLYSTAVFLRDQLRKVEERCRTGKERVERLKEDRTALAEAVKWFELVEQNEQSATNELRNELLIVKAEQSRGIWPLSSATAPCRKPSLDGIASSLSLEVSRPSLLERLQPAITLEDNPSEMFGLLSVPTGGSTSTTSSLRRAFPGTWKQKIAHFLPDVRDVFTSTSQLAEATVSEDDAPRAFGASAGHRVNATSTERYAFKPKYNGGTALKKTKANKPHRKSNKPYVPLLFSKARLMKKKNKEKRLNTASLKISGPFLATPIASGGNFKETSGAGFAGIHY
ncbi:hypothetical protein QCA50_016899 [Cerrena zonata]|uniref:Uncharacterized protein n=1 Tax=Cerrena zonata TaxID=2478898 RepID=A0AAW0FR20_9APHY